MDEHRAVISVDLEFFTHLPAYKRARGTTGRRSVGISAVEDLLEIFSNQDVDATFFVVSEIAEQFPETISNISRSGHEIGSHTKSHRHLSTLGLQERLSELSDSREVLESVSMSPVSGFRAPSFDIFEGHFKEVKSAGYRYDSSVAPCRKIPGWYGGDFDVKRPVSSVFLDESAPAELAELPVAVMPGLGLPLSGAWLRLFGVTYTIAGMRLLARRGITPILYVHPWEFVDLPAVAGVPKRVYWRTGKWMNRALDRILDQPFDYVSAVSVFENWQRSNE